MIDTEKMESTTAETHLHHRLPPNTEKYISETLEFVLTNDESKLNRCLHCGSRAAFGHRCRNVSRGVPGGKVEYEYHFFIVHCTHCGIQTYSDYGFSGKMTRERILGAETCIRALIQVWNQTSVVKKVVKKENITKTKSGTDSACKPPRNGQIKNKAAKKGLDMPCKKACKCTSKKAVSKKAAPKIVKAAKSAKSVKSAKAAPKVAKSAKAVPKAAKAKSPCGCAKS